MLGTRTVLLAFLALVSLNYVQAIKMKLYDRECFFKTAPEAGDRLYGSFVVQKGLAETSKYFYSYIDLQIYDPNNRLIYALERREDYKFEFDAKVPGTYRFCLSIPDRSSFGLPHTSSEDFFVELTWDLHLNRAILDEHAKDEHVDEVWIELNKLASDISFLKYEQNYQKARMLGAVEEAETTDKKVYFYAIVRSLAIVFMSLGQAFIITRFFEQRLNQGGMGVHRLKSSFGSLGQLIGASPRGSSMHGFGGPTGPGRY